MHRGDDVDANAVLREGEHASVEEHARDDREHEDAADHPHDHRHPRWSSMLDRAFVFHEQSVPIVL
jgi:hypothetical protein